MLFTDKWDHMFPSSWKNKLKREFICNILIAAAAMLAAAATTAERKCLHTLQGKFKDGHVHMKEEIYRK